MPKNQLRFLFLVLKVKLTFIFLVAVSLSSFAQNKVFVRGKVFGTDNKPLNGVSVNVKGFAKGVTTGTNGEFNIEVNKGETLVFSFVGYIARSVNVNSSIKELRIYLNSDISTLNEMVVVGYGSVKKEDLTGAVSIIRSDAIENRPIPTLSEAFAGQLSGVRAQNTSGAPGSELEVRIRGINTINGSSAPLYVIDGVPQDNMGDINPSDIASVQILKDASVTAIYGASGGNGVVLIETKKGRLGKPDLRLDAFYGWQVPEKSLDMMNVHDWLTYNIWQRQEAWLRMGSGNSLSDPMSDRPIGLQIPDEWRDPNVKGTDWQDAITVTAPMQSYQLSTTGGGNAGTYFLSGGFLDQDGIIHSTYFKKYNLRFNGSMNISDRIKVGMNLAPSISKEDQRKAGGKDQSIHHAIGQSPYVGINSATKEWGYPEGLTGVIYPNPLQQLKETIEYREKSLLTTSVWADINIIKGLTFRTQYGYSYNSIMDEFFRPTNVQGGETSGSSGTSTENYWIIQNTLTYKRKIKHHVLDLLLGQSASERRTHRINAAATGWSREDLSTLNLAVTPTTASTINTEYKSYTPFFFRISENYKDKYLLNASLRMDGSSRFGPDRRFGIFPAVSVGWKLSKEKFLRDVEWLSLVKIRGAWGTSGNDRIGNYDYISKLKLSNASWGNSIVGGIIPGNIANRDLQWESTTTKDIGLDVNAFKNRIQFSLDYYLNRTNELLFNLPIPLTTGFEGVRTNIGSVQNKGWEIDMTTVNTTGKVRWTTTLNISRERNKVLDMGGVEQFTTSILDGQFITRVGGPVAQFYVYETDGLLINKNDFNDMGAALVPIMPGQIEGGIRYIDHSGDGKITSADLVPYGNNIPDYIYGMTNTVFYKNFKLSVLVQGQIGGDVMFLGQRQMDNGAFDQNTFTRWMHSWKPDYDALYGNENNPIPAGTDMSWDGFTPNVRSKSDNNSDLRIYDGTFWKIKNIFISYSLPKDLIKKVFQSLNLYISIDNVKAFHNYPGITPETNSIGNLTTTPGVDYATYPLARKMTMGVNITF